MYLTEDTTHLDWLNQKAGTKIYFFKYHDYGCANSDTIGYGEEYISVTLDPCGFGIPFFTVPKRILANEPE